MHRIAARHRGNGQALLLAALAFGVTACRPPAGVPAAPDRIPAEGAAPADGPTKNAAPPMTNPPISSPSAAPPTATAASADLPDFGPAPEFVAGQLWLNTEPLTLAGLRGKVVLVEFWTFG